MEQFCVICSTQYDSTQHIPLLVCFHHHVYCSNCVDKMFERPRPTCPECRVNLQRGHINRFRYFELYQQKLKKKLQQNKDQEMIKLHQRVTGLKRTVKQGLDSFKEISKKLNSILLYIQDNISQNSSQKIKYAEDDSLQKCVQTEQEEKGILIPLSQSKDIVLNEEIGEINQSESKISTWNRLVSRFLKDKESK